MNPQRIAFLVFFVFSWTFSYGQTVVRETINQVFPNNHKLKEERFKHQIDSLSKIQDSLLKIVVQIERKNDLLKAEKIRLTDASVRINKALSATTYFSLNKINLSIDDFHLDQQNGTTANPFHGEASFSLLHPEIHLADTNIKVSVDELILDKASGVLKIDSLAISKHDDELQDEGIRLASIKVKHFNWSGFLEEGIIEIDSAMILRGDASINLSNHNKKDLTTSEKKNPYSGNLIILHHVAVNDISYAMLVSDYMKKGDGKVNFQITGDKLELNELRLDPDKTPFASVKEIDVRLKNYYESDSQDKYSVSLGSIKFTDGNLALKDYLLQPSKNSSMSSNNKISVADLIVNQLSLKELLQKKAVAEKIIIGQPEVIIDLNKTNTEHKPQNNLNRSIQNALESWIDSTSDAERRKLEADYQAAAFDSVPIIPCGQYLPHAAWRSNVTGMLKDGGVLETPRAIPLSPKHVDATPISSVRGAE